MCVRRKSRRVARGVGYFRGSNHQAIKYAKTFVDMDTLLSVDGKREVEMPIITLETIEKCNKNYVPNIHFLLKVGTFAALAISTTMPQRSFSFLRRRRFKTFLNI